MMTFDPSWTDRATLLEDETLLHRLSESERGELLEIGAALKRLSSGSYGVCGDCGKSISRKRLRAIPEARLCTECQASHEIAA